MATPVVDYSVDYSHDEFAHLHSTNLVTLCGQIAEFQAGGYLTHGNIQVTYHVGPHCPAFVFHQIMRLPFKGGTEDV